MREASIFSWKERAQFDAGKDLGGVPRGHAKLERVLHFNVTDTVRDTSYENFALKNHRFWKPQFHCYIEFRPNWSGGTLVMFPAHSMSGSLLLDLYHRLDLYPEAPEMPCACSRERERESVSETILCLHSTTVLKRQSRALRCNGKYRLLCKNKNCLHQWQLK